MEYQAEYPAYQGNKQQLPPLSSLALDSCFVSKCLRSQFSIILHCVIQTNLFPCPSKQKYYLYYMFSTFLYNTFNSGNVNSIYNLFHQYLQFPFCQLFLLHKFAFLYSGALVLFFPLFSSCCFVHSTPLPCIIQHISDLYRVFLSQSSVAVEQ